MAREKAKESTIPGMIPALNRSPMEVSVSTPNRISNRLGGMSNAQNRGAGANLGL